MPTYAEDFCPLLLPHTAFRGVLTTRLPSSPVLLLIPDVLYKSTYQQMWRRDTLQLSDTFYSLLRTLYRRHFGEAFQRTLVIGYSRFQDKGIDVDNMLVVETAVLLQPREYNWVSLEVDIFILKCDNIFRRCGLAKLPHMYLESGGSQTRTS